MPLPVPVRSAASAKREAAVLRLQEQPVPLSLKCASRARPAGDLVLKTPRLLTQQPKALSENLRGLAAELGVSRESAAVLCTQQPSLLLLPVTTLRQRIAVRGGERLYLGECHNGRTGGISNSWALVERAGCAVSAQRVMLWWCACPGSTQQHHHHACAPSPLISLWPMHATAPRRLAASRGQGDKLTALNPASLARLPHRSRWQALWRCRPPKSRSWRHRSLAC